MSTIHHDAQTFESHAARERSLGVFDVAAQGIINTHGLADLARDGPNVLDLASEDQALNLMLNLVVELVTIRPKKFYAIIVIRIVRSSKNDSGIGAQTASDVSNPGSWKRANEQHIHAHGEDARRNGIFQHVTGKASVFAEDNLMASASARPGFEIFENVRGSTAKFEGRLGGYWRNCGSGPHPLGGKEFSRSGTVKSALWRSSGLDFLW